MCSQAGLQGQSWIRPGSLACRSLMRKISGPCCRRCYNQPLIKTARIILVTLIFGTTLAGQDTRPPQTQQPRPQDPIILDVSEVNLVVAVTDKKGKFITNLKKEDFRVFEDDKPQTITSFRSETDLPLTITLLVDTSG